MPVGEVRIYQGVKFSKLGDHVLDHDQATILNDINQHLAASRNDFSFIRESTNRVKVPFSYAICSRSNYIAMRNYPYTNIWTFAFIDEIEYVNDNTCYIYYTIDDYHTWYQFLQYMDVFTVREHQDDSSVLNLIPEPVVPSQYVQEKVYEYNLGEYDIVLCYTDPSDQLTGYVAGRMASGAKIKHFPLRTPQGVVTMAQFFNEIEAMQGDLGSIVSAFIYPSRFISTTSAAENHAQYGFPVTQKWNIPEITSIQGYTPKNKKCFTYPYVKIVVDNGEQFNTYRPERFHEHTVLAEPVIGYNFNIVGCAMPTAELSLYPIYYDGYDDINGSSTLSQDMSSKLPMGSFPQVAIPIDTYKSWLAQNQSSQVFQIISGLATGGLNGGMSGGAVGGAVGGASAMLSGTLGFIGNQIAAEDASNHWAGSQGGSLDISQMLKGYHCQILVPPRREIQAIDRFFSCYGYQLNSVGYPNRNTRQNWNYVQVRGTYVFGAVPNDALQRINDQFNDGVTIWHNYARYGDYQDYSNPLV